MNMQTFLPYPNFRETARVLDMKRLGKQRVETLQLMKALLVPGSSSWVNHPAAKMWKGYESALLHYQQAIIEEWKSKGYKDTCMEKTAEIYFKYAGSQTFSSKIEFPPWLGDEQFHTSHRSNLLRKKPEWYNQYGWPESNDIPYVWPH